MKPIGTITMDFHFIGSAAKRFLVDIMKRSKNYSDYVSHLCEHVMRQRDLDDDLVLLAIRHSEYLGKSRIYSKILKEHTGKDVVLPYHLTHNIAEKDEWDNILKEIDRIIQDCNADWITYWYLIHLYWHATTRALDSYIEEIVESRIEEMVQRNDSLLCYTPQFYYLKSQRLRYEGDIARALEFCELALQQSRQFDDKYFESRTLKEMGALTGFYSFGPGSIDRAKPFLVEARKICENLGDLCGLIEILGTIGVMSGLRGEYNEFKDINLEVLKLRELNGDEPTNEFHNAAVVSNQIGDGKTALEWAKMAVESAKSRPLLLPYVHLDMAWALIILNRLDEATKHIDISRKFNIKSGLEAGLAFEYMINGLLERAKGDYDSAFYSLESALEINERNSKHNRMIFCLMMLAETEVVSFEPNPSNRDHEMSGQWLERFDKLVREMELPGFIGNALYLKSELRLKQGRHEEAQQLISEVLQLSKKPGLAYLHEKAVLLQEVRVPRERS